MASINFANTYETAGLDVDKIQKLKDAINAYTKKLTTLAEKLDPAKNAEWAKMITNAIKGTTAEASAKSYIASICESVKKNIGMMSSFAKALDELEKRYKEHDSSCTGIEFGDYPVAKKPIMYLYPEKEMEISVKFTKNEDVLLSTYPKYNNGWKVTANPNGDLYDKEGNYYYSLFWDGKDNTPNDMTEGFVVKGEDTATFLREKLLYMGFSKKETNEFVIYWLGQMEHNKYNYIRFRQTEEINEYMPVEFSTEPDTLLRVIMDYKPLEEKVEVKEQKLYSTERKGFVVTEWGGRLI
jgi:hypothetical protein